MLSRLLDVIITQKRARYDSVFAPFRKTLDIGDEPFVIDDASAKAGSPELLNVESWNIYKEKSLIDSSVAENPKLINSESWNIYKEKSLIDSSVAENPKLINSESWNIYKERDFTDSSITNSPEVLDADLWNILNIVEPHFRDLNVASANDPAIVSGELYKIN